MNKQGTKKTGKVLSYILIVLVLVAVCGLLVYFTNGFTGDFKTFYVECDGKQVLASTGGFLVTEQKPLTVDVKYTFGVMNKDVSGYSVKVVPNTTQGNDFDFTLDGNAYSFQAEDDLTAGFEIVQDTTSFTIKSKGGINDILKAVYPNYEIGDCSDQGYTDMFTLVVYSYNGEASVRLNFSIDGYVSKIVLDKEVIVF